MASDAASSRLLLKQNRVDLKIQNIPFRLSDFVLDAVKLGLKRRIEISRGKRLPVDDYQWSRCHWRSIRRRARGACRLRHDRTRLWLGCCSRFWSHTPALGLLCECYRCKK